MGKSVIGREAVLADIASRVSGGVLVQGLPGVGISALTTEIEARLRADGHEIVRIVGSRALQDVDLGALIHLLPPDLHSDDPLTLLRAARRAIPEGRAAVVVDDAHFLDDLSASLVVQLVNAGLPVVAGSHAATPQHPRHGSEILEAGLRHVVVVPPLSEVEVESMAVSILGGPISPSLRRHLMHLCQGIPGLITVLLSTAYDDGLLAETPRGFTHTGSLATSRGTARLRNGLAAIIPEARDLLVALSLSDIEIPTEVAEALWPEGLANTRWFGITAEKETKRCAVLHSNIPLVGEVLRQSQSPAEINQLIEAMLSVWPNRAQCMRRAQWVLDAGAELPLAEYMALGVEALRKGEAELAERLADQGLRTGGGDSARLLRARARSTVSPSETIEAELADLANRPGGVAPEAAVHLAHLLALDGRGDAAVSVLRKCLDKATSSRSVLAVKGQLALILWSNSARKEAESIADEILATSDVDPASLSIACLVAASRASTAGHSDAAASFAERVEPVDIIGALTWQAAVMAHLVEGRIDEAEMRCDVMRERGAGEDLVLSITGWITLQAGDFEKAAGQFRAAAANMPFRASPILAAATTAVLAYASARAGEHQAARAALHDLQAFPTRAQTTAAGFERNTRGWLAHLDGDDDAAAAWFIAAADAHRLADHKMFEAAAWYELVVLGQPEPAVRPLTKLAGDRTNWLPAVMRSHATALADRDVARLEDAAASLRRYGRVADAAIARAQAVDLRGDTPGIDRIDLTMTSALTGRESEVARAALRGLTSREIADTLTLSTRTVDNHLYSVYRKLDIGGRADLSTDLLDP